ncbi:hypothetical protein F5Y07DRAFT_407150 [Xylaria sp. FL0933]|nr:hypothetical protein F5Y07DRAFT_407150 [Xylaria sp. FL0933]
MAQPMHKGEFVVVEHAMGDADHEHRGDEGYSGHYLAKRGKKIEIFAKIMEIDTAVKMDRSKTIGTIMVKNGNKILKVAHSGYSTNETRSESCLNTERWNLLALHHVARQIHFKFPGNIRDSARMRASEEFRGRAHAGHVEVLLASWYIVELLRTEFEFADKKEECIITQLRRLRGASLGNRRAVFITIDSEPCRTCLQFLNKLARYTGVGFTVYGSKGIGPVQVRVEGHRRQDVILDTFQDSEDEMSETGNGNETTDPSIVSIPISSGTPAPVTPARTNLRRPGSSLKYTQWTPDDPEEFPLLYKQKTPVYHCPGENVGPDLSLGASLEIEISGAVDELEVMDYDEENSDEWVDIGDGLLMYNKSVESREPEAPSMKQEQQCPSPSPPRETQRHRETRAMDGEVFARSAYQFSQEPEYEVITPRQYHIDHSDRRNRPTPIVRSWRSHQPIQQETSRLEQYRRQHNVSDTDESIFKSRYSILRPNNRFFGPSSGKSF